MSIDQVTTLRGQETESGGVEIEGFLFHQNVFEDELSHDYWAALTYKAVKERFDKVHEVLSDRFSGHPGAETRGEEEGTGMYLEKEGCYLIWIIPIPIAFSMEQKLPSDAFGSMDIH